MDTPNETRTGTDLSNATLNVTTANVTIATLTWGGALSRAFSYLSPILYAGICFFIWIGYNLYTRQNQMLYHPTIPGAVFGRTTDSNPAPLDSPLDAAWGGDGAGIAYEEAFVASADGTRVHVWLLWAPPRVDAALAPTVVMCHANAGNMALRLPFADLLHRGLSANVVLWDYRGFGSSGGEPGEEGILEDGAAVLAWLAAHPKLHPGRIFLHGQSLGGAVAIQLAAGRGVRVGSGQPPPPFLAGLIVENTFTSISHMVDHLLPSWVAVLKPFVLKLKWDSLSAIPHVTTPILFVSGLKDTLVPPRMMAALKAAAERAEERDVLTVAEGGHNDTPAHAGPLFLERFHAFVHRVVARRAFAGGDAASGGGALPRNVSQDVRIATVQARQVDMAPKIAARVARHAAQAAAAAAAGAVAPSARGGNGDGGSTTSGGGSMPVTPSVGMLGAVVPEAVLKPEVLVGSAAAGGGGNGEDAVDDSDVEVDDTIAASDAAVASLLASEGLRLRKLARSES